jgi:hypothetical protein
VRKYNDKEVGQILAKAAALQSGSSEISTPEGVTLAELQRVADELGIDPKMIDRAATELDTLRQITASTQSNTVLLEQTVTGELSEETWEDLVTKLRAFAGSAGKTETTPRKREWIGGGETQSLVFTVTTRQGQTHLKLMGDNSGASVVKGMLGFVIGMFSTFGPLIANVKTGVFGPLLTPLLMILVVASAVLITTIAIRSGRRKFAARVNSVMDRLVETVESDQEKQMESPQYSSLSNTAKMESPSITTSA